MSIRVQKRLFLLLCIVVLNVILFTTQLNDFQKLEKVTFRQKSTNVPALKTITDFGTKPPLPLSSTTLTGINDSALYDDLKTPQIVSSEELSRIVQTQLANLQNPKDCSVPTLKCGHTDPCGLGCQMHHRIACLMISYATGMPLIHEETYSWPYSKRWSQTFYPLGSPCTPGPNTKELKSMSAPSWVALLMKAFFSTGHIIPFPLSSGIVVPKALGDKVEVIHSKPFFWWIGQFMKYGLRLLPKERKMVQDAQDSVKFSHPIVGIHVRRTDKISQETHSSHKIEEYFAVAEEYYLNLTEKGVRYEVKRVFLASDDHTVLRESQKMYPPPDWNVIGFHHGRTLTKQIERKRALDQMVQDLYTLADCDYVVCTYSSNVCGVVTGMFSMNDLDGLQRIKSIDIPYIYYHIFRRKIPIKILKH